MQAENEIQLMKDLGVIINNQVALVKNQTNALNFVHERLGYSLDNQVIQINQNNQIIDLLKDLNETLRRIEKKLAN